MADRVLLFGADGRTPVVLEDGDGEELSRTKALLVEAFGALLGFQVQTGEWPNKGRATQNLLHAITKTVSPERLMERFASAGLEITTPEQERAAQLAEVEKVKAAAAQVEAGVAGKPFKAITGGKA